MFDVLIIDYKINNISSITNAILKLGYTSFVADSSSQIKDAKKIILPGVGSFDSAMNILEQDGWKNEIQNIVEKYNVPILGICLGMQLLGEKSEEGNKHGFSFIKGAVKKINIEKKKIKLPHIGWNEMYQNRESKLFQLVPNNKDFYFVHSYFFEVKNSREVLGSTLYGHKFPSVVKKENIIGVQFHPEKSSKYGLQLIKNFMDNY